MHKRFTCDDNKLEAVVRLLLVAAEKTEELSIRTGRNPSDTKLASDIAVLAAKLNKALSAGQMRRLAA